MARRRARSAASAEHFATWAARLITCRFGAPQKARRSGQARSWRSRRTWNSGTRWSTSAPRRSRRPVVAQRRSWTRLSRRSWSLGAFQNFHAATQGACHCPRLVRIRLAPCAGCRFSGSGSHRPKGCRVARHGDRQLDCRLRQGPQHLFGVAQEPPRITSGPIFPRWRHRYPRKGHLKSPKNRPISIDRRNASPARRTRCLWMVALALTRVSAEAIAVALNGAPCGSGWK